MDQDGTWPGGRVSPGDCVRWAPSPLRKKGAEPGGGSPISAHVYCGHAAAWIKMALGMEVAVGPGHIVLDGNLAPVPKNGGRAPNFQPIFIVAKRLDASRCNLVWTGGRPQPR